MGVSSSSNRSAAAGTRPEDAHSSSLGSRGDAPTTTPGPAVAHAVLRYSCSAGKKAYFVSSHDGWRGRFPMTRSGDDFYAYLNLAPGEYEYRVVVDDVPVLDRARPVAASSVPHEFAGKDGPKANVLSVGEVGTFGADRDDATLFGIGLNPSAAEGWTTQDVAFEETRKHPPTLPAHLRYSPLNSFPEDRRTANLRAATSGALHGGTSLLPMPLSVTVNHTYFQSRDSFDVVGVTTRYYTKYTTTVLYTPSPEWVPHTDPCAELSRIAAASRYTLIDGIGDGNGIPTTALPGGDATPSPAADA
eukprot:TRINITY_DN34345_c0_g1_i1.p1 TRINITY_DN34345_c0_g1~~TRINITY_DN34345_c0_g1_i1.p1  ORF type:complete len:303 (+),score=44.93 TRINITY_DN34345_c0_g1_i1:172-1080(+)